MTCSFGWFCGTCKMFLTYSDNLWSFLSTVAVPVDVRVLSTNSIYGITGVLCVWLDINIWLIVNYYLYLDWKTVNTVVRCTGFQRLPISYYCVYNIIHKFAHSQIISSEDMEMVGERSSLVWAAVERGRDSQWWCLVNDPSRNEAVRGRTPLVGDRQPGAFWPLVTRNKER